MARVAIPKFEYGDRFATQGPECTGSVHVWRVNRQGIVVTEEEFQMVEAFKKIGGDDDGDADDARRRVRSEPEPTDAP